VTQSLNKITGLVFIDALMALLVSAGLSFFTLQLYQAVAQSEHATLPLADVAASGHSQALPLCLGLTVVTTGYVHDMSELIAGGTEHACH